MRSMLGVLSIVVFLCVAVTDAAADDETTYWQHDPATVGDWFDPANWTDGVPQCNGTDRWDVAYVDNGGTAQIDDGLARANVLHVGGATQSTVVQEAGGTLEVPNLQVGCGSNGVYEMYGGQLRDPVWAPLTSPGLDIGRGGTGTFRVYGGVMERSRIEMGFDGGQALFEMTGGEVVLHPYGVDMDAGATFRQTGGRFTAETFRVRDGARLEVGPTAELTTDGEFICNSSVMGSVVQTGGAVTIEDLDVGRWSGREGTYKLQGGTLQTRYFAIGSYEATGTFRQTGGTHAVSANGGVEIASTLNLNSRGTYELVGGLLTTPSITLGGSSATAALFAQEGGDVETGSLTMRRHGIYEYAGGSLQVASRLELDEGTLDFGGSAVTLAVGDGAWVDLSGGTIARAGAATLTVGADSFTRVAAGVDLTAAFASFQTDGVVHEAGSTFVIPAGETLTWSAGWENDFADFVRCEGEVHVEPGNRLSLGAGLQVASGGRANLGTGTVTVTSADAGMAGHELHCGDIKVAGDASFTQSAGATEADEVLIGTSSSGGEALYHLTGDSLTARRMTIGDDRLGRVVQEDGAVSFSEDLIVRVGHYEMYDGSLAADQLGIRAYLHSTGWGFFEDGVGTLTQAAGTCSTRELSMGNAAEYALQGGSLEVTEAAEVRGRVTQSGGAASFQSLLLKGDAAAYELSAGSLTAGTVTVSPWSSGVVLPDGVRQTGGTAEVSALTVEERGRYELSSGNLQIGTSIVVSGALDFAGGDGALTFLAGATGNFASGDIRDAAGASMVAGADTHLYFPEGFNPYTDLLAYQCDGQTHLFGDVLEVAAGQTVYLSGSVTSRVRCAGTVLPQPGAAAPRLLKGLELLAGGRIDLGAEGDVVVDDDLSSVAGGELTAWRVRVGTETAAGQLVQSGGTVTVGDIGLFVGAFHDGDEGTYVLQDGSLTTTETWVGLTGVGVFRQTGGTHAPEALDVGTGSDGQGTYEMSGGTLDGAIRVGRYHGARFEQTGGTVQGILEVWNTQDGGSAAVYELSGTGALDVESVYVWGAPGDPGGPEYRAQFLQTGAATSVTVGDELKVDGLYALQAGSVQSTYVGVAEVFRQSGGSLTTSRLRVGADGRYEYTGGALQVGNMTVLGTMDFLGHAGALDLPSGICDISGGSIAGAGAASLHLGDQALLIVASGQDPAAMFGTFTNDGLLHTAGETLVVPAGKGFTGLGDLTDRVECHGTAAATPGGALNLEGGLDLHAGTVRPGTGTVTCAQDTFEMTGGELLDGKLWITEGATFRQTGGRVTSYILNQIGYYELAGTGEIDTGTVYVNGYFDQDGGTCRAGTIILAWGPVSAEYNLTDVDISVGTFRVGGYDGPGKLTATGGTVTCADGFWVGKAVGCSQSGKGYLELGGSAVIQAPDVVVGSQEAAEVVQTGGRLVATQSFYVGSSYELRGGSVEAPSLDMDGLFVQSGGTHVLGGDLTMDPEGYTTYELSGGELNVGGTFQLGSTWTSPTYSSATLLVHGGRACLGSLLVGPYYNGTERSEFRISNPDARVEVRESLILGTHARLPWMAAGAAVHMTGSAFENHSQDPAALAGLEQLTLIFEGGPGELDTFEVAGKDIGAVWAGFDENFALGVLQLGGEAVGRVRLVDEYTNQAGWTGAEALYVHTLVLCEGSELALNGLNVYYGELVDQGCTLDTSAGGSMQAVPDPAGLALLAVGSLGLLRRRR